MARFVTWGERKAKERRAMDRAKANAVRGSYPPDCPNCGAIMAAGNCFSCRRLGADEARRLRAIGMSPAHIGSMARRLRLDAQTLPSGTPR